MPLNIRHRSYWRRNLWLTSSLLLSWFLLTFVAGYYAAELNQFVFLGFPLGFYLFAQGNPIIYLLITGLHVIVMEHLERRYSMGEHQPVQNT